MEEGIEAQTQRTLESIKEILAEVGWNMGNIVKCRIFLTNMKEDMSGFSEVYEKYFKEDFPTRFTVEVKGLPLGARVEIDCTATGSEIKNQE